MVLPALANEDFKEFHEIIARQLHILDIGAHRLARCHQDEVFHQNRVLRSPLNVPLLERKF